jgi:hypothetical protein
MNRYGSLVPGEKIQDDDCKTTAGRKNVPIVDGVRLAAIALRQRARQALCAGEMRYNARRWMKRPVAWM